MSKIKEIIRESEENVKRIFINSEGIIASEQYSSPINGEALLQFIAREIKSACEKMAEEIVPEELKGTYFKFDNGITLDWEQERGFNYCLKTIKNNINKFLE
jgi:hypothetical protein